MVDEFAVIDEFEMIDQPQWFRPPRQLEIVWPVRGTVVPYRTVYTTHPWTDFPCSISRQLRVVSVP